MLIVTNFASEASSAELWLRKHQPNLSPSPGTLHLHCDLTIAGRIHDLDYVGGNARQRRKVIRQLQRRGWKVRIFRGRQRGDEIIFEYVET